MAGIQWMIKGPWFTSCNCDIGCPCQFNSLPTHGDCRAVWGIDIEAGYFGDVRLDGVRFAGLIAWPQAIHQGHGEVQPIVDSSASLEQREAVLAIMRGEHTKPGATIFSVFATTIDTMHDPLIGPIEFEANVSAREARMRIPGVVDCTGEPIRNPVTGDTHRALINMPDGFEYTVAEIASGDVTTGDQAGIDLNWKGAHAHFVELHWTHEGVVH